IEQTLFGCHSRLYYMGIFSHSATLDPKLPGWGHPILPHIPLPPHARDCYCIVSQEGPERRLARSEEHTSELQSRENLVCRLLLVCPPPPSTIFPYTTLFRSN